MQILEGFVFMKKSGDALRFLIILVGMLVVSALVLAVVTAFMVKGHMTAGYRNRFDRGGYESADPLRLYSGR